MYVKDLSGWMFVQRDPVTKVVSLKVPLWKYDEFVKGLSSSSSASSSSSSLVQEQSSSSSSSLLQQFVDIFSFWTTGPERESHHFSKGSALAQTTGGKSKMSGSGRNTTTDEDTEYKVLY